MGTRLTSNFNLEEFSCPCCSRVSADFRLVTGLQELREILNKPILVNSAFRCDNHNRSVGGAVNSNHMTGTAADIIVPGIEPLDLLVIAESTVWLNGFGVAERYLHVDVRRFREYWYYNGNVVIPCTRERIFQVMSKKDGATGAEG